MRNELYECVLCFSRELQCTGHDEMREVRGGTKSNVRSASKPLLNVSAMKTILGKIQTLLSSLLEEPVV